LTLLQSEQTHIQPGLYLSVTSSLVGCHGYWAPDPDEYLWYHQRGSQLLEEPNSQLSSESGTCYLGDRTGDVRDPYDAQQCDTW
jgi:hypothetical protein